jgi:glucose/arabinose dehydrogenase
MTIQQISIKIIATIIFQLFIVRFNYCQTPNLQLQEIATGFYHPTDIETAGDSRIFVSQMNGKIMIFENGSVNLVPFLDISSKIKGQEFQGIFGFVFHPNYAENGYLYVHYLIPDNEFSRYSRFTRNPNFPNVADSNSEQIIYEVPYPINGHRSGDMNFGPDGFLYITTGDGAPGARGSIGDVDGNAQNLQSVFGKILRINVNNGLPFTIPADNPFQTINDNIPDEIWASGLRNPWRWSFDKQTGDIWLGDNGQDGWEEIDFLPNGFAGEKNFGWRCFEGAHNYVSTNCGAQSNYIMPIVEYAGYDNNNQVGGSALGGYVYRGSQFSNMKGWYIYADYAQGKFWTLKMNGNQIEQNVLQNITISNPVTFGQDNLGEIYVANFFEGKLFKIVDSSIPLPLNLISFNAKQLIYNTIDLKWATTNESNIETFEIQKRIDTKSFESLGKVQSNSSIGKEVNFYNFSYNQLNINELYKILYFRLKITETNSNSYYSKIIGLNIERQFAKIGEFNPNPSENGIVNIEINSWKSTKVNFKFYSTKGKLIHTENKKMNNGPNQFELEVSKFEPSIYLVEIDIDGEKTYKKILIK